MSSDEGFQDAASEMGFDESMMDDSDSGMSDEDTHEESAAAAARHADMKNDGLFPVPCYIDFNDNLTPPKDFTSVIIHQDFMHVCLGICLQFWLQLFDDADLYVALRRFASGKKLPSTTPRELEQKPAALKPLEKSETDLEDDRKRSHKLTLERALNERATFEIRQAIRVRKFYSKYPKSKSLRRASQLATEKLQKIVSLLEKWPDCDEIAAHVCYAKSEMLAHEACKSTAAAATPICAFVAGEASYTNIVAFEDELDLLPPIENVCKIQWTPAWIIHFPDEDVPVGLQPPVIHRWYLVPSMYHDDALCRQLVNDPSLYSVWCELKAYSTPHPPRFKKAAWTRSKLSQKMTLERSIIHRFEFEHAQEERIRILTGSMDDETQEELLGSAYQHLGRLIDRTYNWPDCEEIEEWTSTTIRARDKLKELIDGLYPHYQMSEEEDVDQN
ncbi:hypothetical protein MPSEU_000873700 [Mayamaea pseudoterrestris]|nr:hypothetical protein MPSEU_000873700 [Mayamaea pseudoterrestris]